VDENREAEPDEHDIGTVRARSSWGVPRSRRATSSIRDKPNVERCKRTSTRKVCPRCGQDKEIGEFPLVKGKPISYCRTCENHRAREYRRKHPLKPGSRRGKHFTRLYGITPAEYERILTEQHGVCAICGQPERLVGGRRGTTRCSSQWTMIIRAGGSADSYALPATAGSVASDMTPASCNLQCHISKGKTRARTSRR